MTDPSFKRNGWISPFLALLIGVYSLHAGPEVPNGPEHEGVQAVVDLPGDMRVHNTGGTDGAGLCVFATLDMIARYMNIEDLIGIMEKMHREQPGGGYPEKVQKMIDHYAPNAGVEIVQYQGTDPAILDMAMLTGRPCGVTYGYGEFYRNQTIYHMVMLVHLDAKWAAIVDNNNEKYVTWMSREDFLKRWVHPQGTGWAYVLVNPPPPPVPTRWVHGAKTAA